MSHSHHPREIVVIGRNCLDTIAVVKRLPAEDRKAPLDFRLVEGGGQGGTAACCIAALGGKVALIGRIGRDDEGAFCMQRLHAFGVDTRLVDRVDGGKTPVAYLFVTRETGRRTIVYEPSRLPEIVLQRDHLVRLSTAGVVLLDPETTYLAAAVRQHAGPHTRIVYDCERWKEGVETMMAVADYFIPSASFLEAMPGAKRHATFEQEVFRLQASVSGQLVVTRGEQGAYYPLDGRLYRVPAPAIRAVDTIGAGDNFHGAFALALTRNTDLPSAVRFAVAVATLSCERYGGRQGLPTLEKALATAKTIYEEIVC